MNRKAFVFVLMAVLTISGLVSCRSNQKIVDSHDSRTVLVWEGVYTGTIPSAGGSGIDVRMKLNRDDTYELTYEYLNRPDGKVNRTGSFQWDDMGSVITLDIKDVPPHYKVGENKLIQLDIKRKPITGNLADNYVLIKEQ